MNNFFELFARGVDQSGIKRKDLAEISGISEGMISRMKTYDEAGRRFCKDIEKMHVLIGALRLPGAEEKELWEAYLDELSGCKGYENHVAVIRMLEHFQNVEEAAEDAEEKNGGEDIDFQKTQQFTNPKAVRKVWRQLIEREAARKDGYVNIQMQPDKDVIDSLAAVMQKNPGLPIEQLVAVENYSGQTEIARKNVDILQELMPAIVNQRNNQYRVYTFQADADTYYSDLHAVQYYIAVSDAILYLSKNMNQAMLVADEVMLEFTRKGFELVKKKSTLLCTVRQELENMVIPCRHVYTFGAQPCFGPFLTQAIAYKYAYKTPKAARKAKMYLKFRDEQRQYIQNAKFYSYFTREGIERFLREGRSDEVPTPLYRPLEMKDRKKMVQALIDMARKGEYFPYLINEESGVRFPKELYFNSFSNRRFVLYFYIETDCMYVSIENENMVQSLLTVLNGMFHELRMDENGIENTLAYLEKLVAAV